MDSLDEKLADLKSRLRHLEEFKRHAGDTSRPIPHDIEDDLKRQIAEVTRLITERNKR